MATDSHVILAVKGDPMYARAESKAAKPIDEQCAEWAEMVHTPARDLTITAEQVKDALLVPIRAIQLQNEQYVVHVLRDGQAVPVRIKLGLSADDYSQVVEGLKEGDVIILNPPMQLNPMMGGF